MSGSLLRIVAAGRVRRPRRLDTVTRTSPNGVIQAIYIYDAAGRTVQINRFAQGTRTVFAYDTADRLTGILHG